MDRRAKGGWNAAREKMERDVSGASRWAVNTAKNLVTSYTGKKEYQFGDITKELVRRTVSGEYNLQDILFVCKLLLAVGASFSPLAKFIPVKVLLDMMNFQLEQQIGGKLLEAVAGSLDDRFKAALFTADDKYQLGDMTKRTLLGAVENFTGKDTYQAGDISRAVSEKQQQTNNEDHQQQQEHPESRAKTKTLEVEIGPELEDWDGAFRKIHPGMDLPTSQAYFDAAASEIQTEWDRERYSGNVGGSLNQQRQFPGDYEMDLDEWDRLFKERYPDSI